MILVPNYDDFFKANPEASDEELYRILEKEGIDKKQADDLFLKKFIVWNKGEYLPRYSTITKKFVKQDLKRLGIKPQKQKSLGDDRYFE